MASDSFAQYLKEAARYPLLDKSQEILLARQVQTWLHDENATPRQKKAGQRAYEKLIKCNLRLVVSVAKRFSGRIKRSEMLDIVQEGNCGLAHGIKKFDPERGYALSTYVYWWIRQSVSRYLSCSDRVIRLPSHAVEMLAKVRAWSPTFQESHGRMPTLQECAEYCKTSPERMRLYMDNANDSISLDSRVSATENDSSLIDLVAGESNLMEDLELVVRADFIDQMLASLEPVDRILVVGHFALDGGEPQTLSAMGKVVGLSRERTRQRLNRAIRRMRVLAGKCSAL